MGGVNVRRSEGGKKKGKEHGKERAVGKGMVSENLKREKMKGEVRKGSKGVLKIYT